MSAPPAFSGLCLLVNLAVCAALAGWFAGSSFVGLSCFAFLVLLLVAVAKKAPDASVKNAEPLPSASFPASKSAKPTADEGASIPSFHVVGLIFNSLFVSTMVGFASGHTWIGIVLFHILLFLVVATATSSPGPSRRAE